MRTFLTILLLWSANLIIANGADLERHVVLVVWDGMRPDFVNGTNTPTLYDLANRGVFFAHHHPVFISSTEVNGTALATGVYPKHSGVIGNREFRPEIDPLQAFGTESLEAMRKADEHGGYLAVPTIAETLQRQGYRTLIAGTKPVVLLHDRASRAEGATNVVLFEGRSLPPSTAVAVTNALGVFYDHGIAKTNRDIWTARALTELLWKKGLPAFSLLWMAEPDNTQHQKGVGSAEALAAIRNSDHALSLIIAAIKTKGVYDTTDILVVSDHGFSTISRTVDMVARMKATGLNVVRQFKKPPATGDVLLVGLGGSVLLYVTGHDEKTIDRVVNFLQTEDSVGAIFTTRARPGTFAIDDVLMHSQDAPDVAFSFRWTGGTNVNGAAGTVVSESEGSNLLPTVQKATHASLSPFDMHNTLVAAGPDFRQGFIDDTPSGNVDVAPTILKILGVKPLRPMDGRVLSEALDSTATISPVVEKKVLRARATLPTGEWTQTLDISEVNGVRYLDEGTGQFRPNASAKH